MNYLVSINQILNNGERKKLIILIFLFLISSVLEIFSLGMIFPLIQSLLNPELVSNFLETKVNIYINKDDLRILIITSFFLIFLFKNIFIFFFNWWTFRFTNNLNVRLCKDLYSGYLNMDPIFFMKRNIGILMRNLQIEAGLVSKTIYQLITLINEVIIILSISIFLIIFDWKSFLIVSSSLIFFFFFFNYFSKNYIYKLGKLRTERSAKVPKILIEGFNSYKEIQIYNVKNFFINKYASEEKSLAEYNIKQSLVGVLPKLYFEVIFILIFSIFVFYFLLGNAVVVQTGADLITIIGMFAAAAIRILPSSARILTSLQGIRYQKKSFEIIFEDIKFIKESLKSKNLNINPQSLDFVNFLSFKNISFRYGKKKIFDNFNLQINKGEKVGIVGANGKGKSTLLNIFLGFLEPSSGKFTVDDKDIMENLESWRKIVSYVPQNINVMNMSIKENILFGRDKNLNIDDSILRKSCLKEFVNSLEDGINTEISELGKNISGGQAQKIAIARALFAKPEILFMDESTSSIDNEDEKKIIDNLLNDKDLTIVFVTHKKNLLEKFDKVVELK